MDFAKQTWKKLNRVSNSYLDNTVYLIAFLVILTLLIYFFLVYCLNYSLKVLIVNKRENNHH